MDQYDTLMKIMQERYPNFQTWRIIMAGPPGSGKSVAAGSFPVAKNKQRLVLDFEDSMAFIDAGEQGTDVYTPRKQRFAMRRLVFPDLHTIAGVLAEIRDADSLIGALIIDNIAVLQDNIVNYLSVNNPKNIRNLYEEFGIGNTLPFDSMIAKWSTQKDPGFWGAVKQIPKAIMLTTMKNQVHLIGTSEEQNVWQNYGTPNAKVIGKKAKILDTWFRYSDAIIMLNRDINTTNPPMASLNPLQPKLRLQGFNPKWRMDWTGFTEELKASLEREEPEIPEELQVQTEETFEEG
jgi:hypothetical protein